MYIALWMQSNLWFFYVYSSFWIVTHSFDQSCDWDVSLDESKDGVSYLRKNELKFAMLLTEFIIFGTVKSIYRNLSN